MMGNYRGQSFEEVGRVAVARDPLQSSMLDVEFAQHSDVGRVRGHNEDYFGYVLPKTPTEARTHGWLFVLADGVGGHDRGEVASRAAVESLVAGFGRAPGGESHTVLLPRLIQAANTLVFETGLAAVDSVGAAMATTVVACALRYDRAAVANVGDSRCYIIRNGHATLLTRDHTVVSEQMRLGVLSAKEAAESPGRHTLSRSLGNDLFVNVEISDHQVHAGDVLMLSSDGLHGALPANEMARLISHQPDLTAAAQELVALANERDGGDNISVQIIRVRSVERVGMYRGRPYKLR
jgi:serine/threonine protein phosphatase PrpC